MAGESAPVSPDLIHRLGPMVTPVPSIAFCFPRFLRRPRRPVLSRSRMATPASCRAALASSILSTQDLADGRPSALGQIGAGHGCPESAIKERIIVPQLPDLLLPWCWISPAGVACLFGPLNEEP